MFAWRNFALDTNLVIREAISSICFASSYKGDDATVVTVKR